MKSIKEKLSAAARRADEVAAAVSRSIDEKVQPSACLAKSPRVSWTNFCRRWTRLSSRRRR
jgi:hypothetical protein